MPIKHVNAEQYNEVHKITIKYNYVSKCFNKHNKKETFCLKIAFLQEWKTEVYLVEESCSPLITAEVHDSK